MASNPKKLINLEPRECRYPLGDLMAAADADTLFCAKPTICNRDGDPTPWCAEHDRLCHPHVVGRAA